MVRQHHLLGSLCEGDSWQQQGACVRVNSYITSVLVTFLVAVTNACYKQSQRRKDLFWRSVSEILVHSPWLC
jgi:hypothetical protein